MLPKTISALAEDNAALLYNLLFTAASQTLLWVGRTRSLLQAETGFIGVLHTWSQLVCGMPICMCCGSAGAWHWTMPADDRCRPSFTCQAMATAGVSLRVSGVPRAFVSEEHAVLRGVHGHLFASAALAVWIAELYTKTWILHAEPVNLGREREQTHAEAAEQTLGYLAQYANGVALSHQRLLVIEDDNVVLFSHIDRRDDGRRNTTRVLGVGFLDRFLLKCEYFEHVWCQANNIL